jgi:murein DD-endopeptidase MepM/ murein hydrolase activator NlpD
VGGRRRSFRLGLLIALTGAVVVTLTGPSRADPNDDKARVDRQMAQAQATYEAATAQAQAALQAYTAATGQLPGAQDRLAVARGVVAARQAEAEQANRDAAAARTALANADQRYAAASAQVETARTQVGGFVAAAYRGSGLLALDSLLESQSPGDVADRVGYLQQIAENQRQAMDGFLAARMTAKEADSIALDAKQKADETAKAAGDALVAAQAAADQAAQAEIAVTTLINQQAQAKAAADSQRDATLAQYNELKAESDRIAEQLRQLAAQDGAQNTTAPVNSEGGGSAPAMHSGAFFLTPVRGWKSSDYGMRYDPYYHVWQLHAGVDLAAPEGTPIYAAADGTVTQAGWYGGYGNYTCLYHGLYQGRGLSTCYGHQSAILVQVGEQVRRGDLIGRVGTTGASTGDHLHFEVRINGNPVQPLDWLDSCLC